MGRRQRYDLICCRRTARLPPRVVTAPLDPEVGGVRGADGPGRGGRAGTDAVAGPPGDRRGRAAARRALALPHRPTGAGAAGATGPARAGGAPDAGQLRPGGPPGSGDSAVAVAGVAAT